MAEPVCQAPRMRLDHVALPVGDRERSARVYRHHFGMVRRVHDDDHLLILAGDDGSLMARSEGTPVEGLPRTHHFGFSAPDGDTVRDARVRFRDDGVEETEWQDDGRFVRCQVYEPDGYRVEIYYPG